MSLYDIIMLVVFAGAIWFGYWKGLAWQIASVTAIVVSYFVSIKFREPLSQFISAEEPWNRVASMLILFLGSSLVIWTIYASVSKSLKKMELKGFDRQAGALLGAVKGALLCMIITMFSVSMLGEKAHDAIHNSYSGRYVVRGIHQVSSIVPKEIEPYVRPHIEKFENAIGHDANMPLDQYPQFSPYPATGQGTQNPNQVPTYSSQWQLPTVPAPNSNQYYGNGGSSNNGPYANQPAAPTNTNSGFNWNWNNPPASNSQPAGYQQPNNQQPNNQQTGYSQNGNQTSGNSNNGFPPSNQPPASPSITPNTANGWPDVNFNVNTKDVLDGALKTGTDAVRDAFNRANK